jgi:nucleotide-binding universal stress UspA family protein
LPVDVLAATASAGAPAELHPPEETLEVWREDAEARAAIPVRARVLAGDPALALAKFAEEEGMDLLVVGTHGRTGLSRLVVGSVAERVLRHAALPVLVARDHLRLARQRDVEEAAQYV